MRRTIPMLAGAAILLTLAACEKKEEPAPNAGAGKDQATKAADDAAKTAEENKPDAPEQPAGEGGGDGGG